MKREETFVRVNKWQGGKLSELVYPASKLIFQIFISLIKIIFLLFQKPNKHHRFHLIN
jgi:hypothetical protein